MKSHRTTEEDQEQKRRQREQTAEWEKSPSDSEQASRKAKSGEPLRAENPKERSPKQENL